MSSLSSPTVPGGTTSIPLPTASPVPISVYVHHASFEGTDNFFPFHDIATLNADSGSKKSGDFSFKSLLEAGIDGSQEITLFDTGCQIDDGTRDCTVACADSELIFRSLETFYNCAALASMSYWTQDYMVFVVTDEAEKNASSIMGSGTLADFEDRPFLDAFVGCAQDSCRNDGLGVPCVDDINRLSNSSTPRQILDVIDDYCPSVAAEINPDIFGPGVSPKPSIPKPRREFILADICGRYSSPMSFKCASPLVSTSSSRALLSGSNGPRNLAQPRLLPLERL